MENLTGHFPGVALLYAKTCQVIPQRGLPVTKYYLQRHLI